VDLWVRSEFTNPESEGLIPSLGNNKLYREFGLREAIWNTLGNGSDGGFWEGHTLYPFDAEESGLFFWNSAIWDFKRQPIFDFTQN